MSENIDRHEFDMLNGAYTNTPDSIIGGIEHAPYDALDDYQRLTILGQLFWHIPQSAWYDSSGTLIEPEAMSVYIDFQTRKRAIVRLYHDERFAFSKAIHGKFKNGYFYVRPKVYIIPIIPIVFGFNFERVRIGKLDDSLVIDYTVNRWGFFLFSGSSDIGMASSIYQKK